MERSVSVSDLAAKFTLACALVACGSPPPGSVGGDEQPAIDLEACARGDSSCTKLDDPSKVTAVESLAPGSGHALLLEKGGGIRAPLLAPDGKQHLSHLVVGLHTLGTEGQPRQLQIAIDDGMPAILGEAIVPGFGRIEIAELGNRYVAGMPVTIRCTEGSFELVYVVGRWDP